MHKKFLFIGMAAILGASLVFLGCDDGSGSGSDGAPGDVTIANAITAEALKAAFEHSNRVIIYSTNGNPVSVYGEVTAGKTLLIAEKVSVVVPVDKALDVKAGGTLEISKDAVFNASCFGTVGRLKNEGTVNGVGTIVLPYQGGDGASIFDGAISVSPRISANIAIGAYIHPSAANPGKLTSDIITGIYSATITKLSVANVTGLTVDAIPKGATLTLAAGSSSLADGPTFTVPGNLIVEEGATLTTTDNSGTAISAAAASGSDPAGSILIKGTL
jgi:hypothetical protein